MRGSVIPDGFRTSLEIALRRASQQPRVNYASKNPDLRDNGARDIAAEVVAKLKLGGWTITEKRGDDSHVPPLPSAK